MSPQSPHALKEAPNISALPPLVIEERRAAEVDKQKATGPTTTEDLAARVAESGIPEARRESAAAVKVGGLLVSALEALASSWGGLVDRVRSSGRLPAPVRVPSSPHPNTNFVSCIPPRISSISGAPSGDGEDADQRSAGDCSRSGPRLLQPPLPGGKGDGRLAPRDRPVDFEHLHSTDTVQDGDGSLRLERCPREQSPRLPGLKGRVLPGARPPKFQEVSALHVTGDSVPVQGSLLRTVHCPPSLDECVRISVSVGAHSRNLASPLIGPLAGSGLLGDQGPSARPRPSLVVSRSGDRGQREEIGSRALTLCELSRDDDRRSGGQGFSLESESGENPSPGGQLCKDELAPPPLARQWEVLLGHLSSLEKLVPRGRLRLCSMQWQLNTIWSPEDDPPDLPVELTQEIREDLSW